MNLPALLDPAICVRLILTFAHFLWQGVAVFAVAAAAAVILRRASANARYTTLVAAMLLMAACPPVTFVMLGEPAPGEQVTSDAGGGDLPPAATAIGHAPGKPDALPYGAAPAADAKPQAQAGKPASTGRGRPLIAELPRAWQRYAPHAVSVYLLGTAVMFGRLLLAVYGGQRLRRRSHPVEDGTILTAFSRQARALGLPFTPAIAFCRDVAVPTVVGVLRPMILLPLSLTTGLTPGQVEALLSHELAHIRRYDYLINFLQRIIEAVLFFHPAVWFVSRRIRTERENCCDDMVLAAGGQRFAYAESLVRMAELSRVGSAHQSTRDGGGLSPPFMAAVALGADGQRSQLRNRVMRLIAGPPSHEQVRLKRTWTLVLCVLAVSALTLNCLVPARQPDASSPATAGEGGGQGRRDLLNAIRVRALCDGVVAEAKVADGQTVKAGDLLVQIDDREIRLGLDAAKARLQLLTARYEALAPLKKERAISGEEFEKAASEKRLAEIELERQQLRLERTRIYSPADGTVRAADGNLLGLRGQRVTAGSLVLYILPDGQAARPAASATPERSAAAMADDVPVFAPADGIVAEVKVKEGDTARKGDLLLQLDDKGIKLETERAKKQLQDLRELHARLDREYKAGLRTEEEPRRVATQVKLAEIEVERQTLRLERTRISSPADGTVRAADGSVTGLRGKRLLAGSLVLSIVPAGRAASPSVEPRAPHPVAAQTNEIPVRASADGIVAEVMVKEGQTVKKGDLLAQLDGREIKLDIETAKVRLRGLRERADRLAAMSQAGVVPNLEAQTAAAEVRPAEIELERQELRLQNTRIVSPADGTIDAADGGLAGFTGARVVVGQVLLYVAPPGTTPRGMIGTWFFDNPEGDDEQMAVFSDGRVVVLYSNGHRDETRIIDGAVQLAEYRNARARMSLVGDGMLIQTSDSWNGMAKRWTRIDPTPRGELLRPLSGLPATRPAATQPAGGAGNAPPALIQTMFVEVTGEAGKLDPVEVLKRLPPGTTPEGGLDALKTFGRTEVVSRPSVLVLWPQKATITIGEKTPIVSEVTPTPDGKMEPKISYVNVGLTLGVQAQWLTEDNADRVRIDLHIQETAIRSTKPTAGSGITLPTFISREWDRSVTTDRGVGTWIVCNRNSVPVEKTDKAPTPKENHSLMLLWLTVQPGKEPTAASQPTPEPAHQNLDVNLCFPVASGNLSC